MEFEADDLPQGFGGSSNWEQVVQHLEVYYVKWTHGGSRWIGVSRRDDLKDKGTIEKRRLTAREQQARWYEKMKSDPVRVARRNAVKRRNHHERKNR